MGGAVIFVCPSGYVKNFKECVHPESIPGLVEFLKNISGDGCNDHQTGFEERHRFGEAIIVFTNHCLKTNITWRGVKTE